MMTIVITAACSFMMMDLPKEEIQPAIKQCERTIDICYENDEECDRYTVLYDLIDIRDQAQPEPPEWYSKLNGFDIESTK